MLFRPAADQRLEAILGTLEGWNEEADRVRAAAIAARRGEAPSTTIVASGEEAHEGLLALLEDIDRAIDSLAPGDRAFPGLLAAQAKAIALLESISNSLGVLTLVAAEDRPAPVHLAHRALQQAAE